MSNKQVKKAEENPLLTLAKVLRSNSKLETRDAVLDGTRVDFFRGKDLLKLIKEDESILDPFQPKLKTIPATTTGGASKVRPIEDQVAEIANLLMRAGFFVRTERLQKTPKPGRKLLKFPKKLEMCSIHRFDEEGFYAWRWSLPQGWGMYLGSAALVVFTIGCCLFPLSPHWCKLGVLYTCLVLLGIIFFVAVVRWIVYGAVWIFLGRYFWICPNLFSDDVGILDAFKPFFWVSPLPAAGEEDLVPKRENRAVVGLLVAATCYWCFQTAPDGDEMRAKAYRTHKSILEMLDLHQPNKFLEDLTSVNTTNSSAAGDATASEGEVPQAPPPPEPEPEADEQEEEIAPPSLDDILKETELEEDEDETEQELR